MLQEDGDGQMAWPGGVAEHGRSRHGGAALRLLGALRLASRLTTMALAAAAAAHPRIVLVVEQSASIYEQAAVGFAQGFGNTDAIERIPLDADPRRLDAVTAEIRRLNPRLVVTIGTNAAIAIRNKLPSVPIVYCLALNPLQNNLRGADIGGVAFDLTLQTQMANLQRALPNARRIGVIYNEPVSGKLVREARAYLHSGVKLIPRDARNPSEAARAIEELAGSIDAFWLLWDPVIANPANFRLLVDFCLRNKIALISPATPFVEAGALMSIGADYLEAGRRTGTMAKEILSGRAKPGDFPAEPPPVSLVLVNGGVARRLGIEIPRDVGAHVLAAP
ncbi:MAG TPA: ABC transporter substrate-binding protein [Bryobacteraceae bacterium]|nr:ABC transporter substrate-binding protein [Bryobacteraceae bacterium]